MGIGGVRGGNDVPADFHLALVHSRQAVDHEFGVLLPTDPPAGGDGFLLGVEVAGEIRPPGLFDTPASVGMGNDMMRLRFFGHGCSLGQTESVADG